MIYIDDILIMGSDEVAVENLKKYLHYTFHIKDLGPPIYFLGIKIAQLNLGISS